MIVIFLTSYGFISERCFRIHVDSPTKRIFYYSSFVSQSKRGIVIYTDKMFYEIDFQHTSYDILQSTEWRVINIKKMSIIALR